MAECCGQPITAEDFFEKLVEDGFELELGGEYGKYTMTAERDINGAPVSVYMPLPANPDACYRKTLGRFEELLWCTLATHFNVGHA